VPSTINIQKQGGMTKAHQVRQFLAMVERMNLKPGDDS
jgi:hypothetical protein